VGRGLPIEQVYELISSHNQTHCEPPLDDVDVRRIVFGIEKAERQQRRTKTKAEESADVSQFREQIPPQTLSKTAYYGLLGEIIEKVSPYSEASNEAILAGVITAFGNKVGRNAFFRAQQDFHYTNLYTVVVGDTATARKGVAWSLTKDLLTTPEIQEGKKFVVNMDEASHAWGPMDGGIASGEGIIELVKDDIQHWDTKLKQYVIEEGSGVEDKRVLFYEAEFASVLRKAVPPTSIIWPVLRTLWDSGTASNSSKINPIRTTNAHVSLLGNITELELRIAFPEVEMTSGSANRILWVWSKRSKCLPEGKPVPRDTMQKLQRKIHSCVQFGQRVGELSRDAEAKKLWEDFYRYTWEHPQEGFLGAILARAEAQVLRLSIIYALLDKSSIIKKVHLEAALAFWNYAKASSQYLFMGKSNNPLDNKIINILEDCADYKTTRTSISNALANAYLAKDLDTAYQRLKEMGIIEEVRGEKSGTGRKPSWIRLRKTTQPQRMKNVDQ
jgi:hypothetical protein